LRSLIRAERGRADYDFVQGAFGEYGKCNQFKDNLHGFVRCPDPHEWIRGHNQLIKIIFLWLKALVPILVDTIHETLRASLFPFASTTFYGNLLSAFSTITGGADKGGRAIEGSTALTISGCEPQWTPIHDFIKLSTARTDLESVCMRMNI
jgi:hypothetical protein